KPRAGPRDDRPLSHQPLIGPGDRRCRNPERRSQPPDRRNARARHEAARHDALADRRDNQFRPRTHPYCLSIQYSSRISYCTVSGKTSRSCSINPVQSKGACMDKSASGWINGLIGVIIFSGSLPATRVAVQQFDPVFLTVARAAIAGLLALGLLLVFRQKRPARADFVSL